jgi:hypothetical protein
MTTNDFFKTLEEEITSLGFQAEEELTKSSFETMRELVIHTAKQIAYQQEEAVK